MPNKQSSKPSMWKPNPNHKVHPQGGFASRPSVKTYLKNAKTDEELGRLDAEAEMEKDYAEHNEMEQGYRESKDSSDDVKLISPRSP